MKKILIALLALTLCIGLVACGNSDDAAETTTAETTVENSAAEGVIAPEIDSASVGGQHWDAFTAAIADDADATAEELANTLVSLEINQFMGGALPVDPEYFPGFDNYLPTGYESGAMFMPMIGSIAYVGYVFELPEDADAAAFIADLEANANPRWNICVEADQVVAGAVGNKVLFLMCPSTYEMPTEDGGDMGMAL